jgi:hypothetical protein
MSVFERLAPDDDDEDEDEGAEAASSKRLCVDCGASAPRTKTAHTLISSKHGWRLERIAQENGHFRFDWRCPKCWLAHRKGVPPSSRP